MMVVWRLFTMVAAIIAGCGLAAPPNSNNNNNNVNIILENADGDAPCCLCDRCAAPMVGVYVGRRNATSCTDLAQDLANQTTIRADTRSCRAVQDAYRDKCCDQSSTGDNDEEGDENDNNNNNNDGDDSEGEGDENNPFSDNENEGDIDQPRRTVCENTGYQKGTEPVCSWCGDGILPPRLNRYPYVPEWLGLPSRFPTCRLLYCMGIAGIIPQPVCLVLSETAYVQCGCEEET